MSTWIVRFVVVDEDPWEAAVVAFEETMGSTASGTGWCDAIALKSFDATSFFGKSLSEI